MIEPLWEKGALFAGKYRVESVLGRGGMGVVLGARHARLDEPVAIKVLLPAMLETPGVVDRFLREARAVAKIKSPHVARVTDVDTLPSGLPYIVMERLDGVDLAALCKQKATLSIEECVRYIVEACDALAEAHARGIVHRDLKPGNLFLAQLPDGTAAIKVLDFGISKLATEGEEHAVTEAGVALGSPSYMSPEQMRSARDVDARTDIWALGAVLFRLLTGKTPFRADSLPRLYTLVTNETLQRPSELRADLPPGLEAVLVRCLEKDPARRYPSVADLAEALLPFAGEGARAPISRVIPAPAPSQPDGIPQSSRDEVRSFEASQSAQMTSAVRVRMESEASSSTEAPPPGRTKGSAVRTILIAVALGAVTAGAGLRVVHHTSGPVAAGAANVTGPAMEASLAAPSLDATSVAATAAPSAMPAPSTAPEPSTTAAPSAAPAASPEKAAGAVVPAGTGIAQAAPPKPSKPLPRHTSGDKKGVLTNDPFGGGRK